MAKEEKKGRYPELMLIGEVAKRLGIHEQTIRTYEREGLLKPMRSQKNTRYFSKQDITKIMIIITLTQEFGLNRSGVSLMFNLAKKRRMKDEDLLEFIEDQTTLILGFRG